MFAVPFAAFSGSRRFNLAPVNLLFIGDIVGEPGRRAVKQLLPKLRAELRLDMVVANGENAAGGSGITVNTANEIFGAGVDIMTTGDHLWDQRKLPCCCKRNRAFCGRSIIRPA